MRRIDGLEALASPGAERPRRSVVTVGKFFALHRGHQALIRATCARARELGAPCVVLTFDRHPQEVLRPGTRMPILAPLAERLEVMEALGVDWAIIVHVTPEFLTLVPAEFVERVLVGLLDAQEVFASANFRFGRGAAGTVATLRELGARHGLRVREFPPVMHAGEPISSSRVARSLLAGDVALARELLGRPYTLRCRVVRGDGRGRLLGFPTANLVCHEEQLLPADGVYSGMLRWNGENRLAVINLGVRPTVDGTRHQLEAHLLDFAGDLYGRDVRLAFCHRLREERRFDSLADLVAQIARDVAQARELGPCE